MGKTTIWLHIGTAKSGTTALQHSFRDHADVLRASGLHYFCAGRHSSVNKLAIAINRNRGQEIENIRQAFAKTLRKAEGGTLLISSEMFFGMAPEKIFFALPALCTVPVNVLVYLRRQDRYIESKYLQKMKNGRFKGSIEKYIEKFSGSGSDYWQELQPWQKHAARIVPRICERGKLIGRSTVSDALHVMGFGHLTQALRAQVIENPSPSLGRIQLMQALSDVGFPKIRRIQRALPADASGKARIFSHAERNAYLARYAQSNQMLKSHFFATEAELFDPDGLSENDAPPSSGFSSTQLKEITEVFRVLQKQYVPSASDQVGSGDDEDD